MTTLFISHGKEDADYAEQLGQKLEPHHYSIWRDPGYPPPQSASYPRFIENAILRSAALILLWSNKAARDEWVERHILFAQQLKKRIVPVLLDNTGLPNTLVAVSPIPDAGSSPEMIVQLTSALPAAEGADTLLALSEQAAHEFVRERKAAIERATQMIQENIYREEALALLAYLANNDLMMGVREKAQVALDASNGLVASTPSRPGESRHFFGVRCTNGHISYFDKRYVCGITRPEIRGGVLSAGKELDELHLSCETCGCDLIARVDCEGYK